MTRLVSMCLYLSHLQISAMDGLSEAGRLSMVSLLRQIMESSRHITVLNMVCFSSDKDLNENIGELVLEILLNSNIEIITELHLRENSSWFKHPRTKEEKSRNVDLLMEFIIK